MAKFVLCWHKERIVEEVEAARINDEWLGFIAYGDLDVLKIRDDKAFILDSAGAWKRVKAARDRTSPSK